MSGAAGGTAAQPYSGLHRYINGGLKGGKMPKMGKQNYPVQQTFMPSYQGLAGAPVAQQQNGAQFSGPWGDYYYMPNSMTGGVNAVQQIGWGTPESLAAAGWKPVTAQGNMVNGNPYTGGAFLNYWNAEQAKQGDPNVG